MEIVNIAIAARWTGVAAVSLLTVWLGYGLVVCWNKLMPNVCKGKEYSQAMQQKGYVPPAPSESMQRSNLRVSRFFNWLLIGKMQISGLENLELLPVGTPYIVTPNHSHYADMFVLSEVMQGRKARFMAAASVMKLLGRWLGPRGAFRASHEAGVEVLSSGQPMVLFPEGWAYVDGKMGRCHKGAVRISRDAAKLLGEPTYIVPVFVRYGKYPGSWIRKLEINCQFAFMFVFFLYYRRGARTVIGKPIASSSLPASDATSTDFIFNKIRKLDPEFNDTAT